MHPALSVVIFTTLSGMGYGLWAWLGMRLAFGPRPVQFEPIVWFLALIGGGILAALGLAASFFHLGKPLRAWRAFSQWRTSWLSREGVLALASFGPAIVLLLPLHNGFDWPQRLCGLLLALLSLATVACTAMIYASLKPIPAWRHALVLPVYAGFSLLTGGLAFWPMALAAQIWVWLPWALMLLAAALIAMKIAYWRSIDTAPLPQTRGDAVGLPHRTLSIFEHPHTEANYITREMGFVLARQYARFLRTLTIALLAACLLGIVFCSAYSVTPWLLALPCAGALAASFVERWLFFAQAKHMVMLYY